MSDLQRSFARAKLASLPMDPPLPADQFSYEGEGENGIYAGEENDKVNALRLSAEASQDDDSSSSASSSASSASSTGTIRPSPSKHLFARPNKGSSAGRRTLDPLPWNDYFTHELYLKSRRASDTTVHHVYLIPPTDNGVLIVTHHGAGSTGLSFALFALEIRRALPHCGVLSLDARGHGETECAIPHVASKNQPQPDLRLTTLSEDLFQVITLAGESMGWPRIPEMILVGHSLGGAVVVDLAANGKLGDAVLGYCILDVVEGSAIEALGSMQSYLSTRPASFPSISSAIEWHTRTRTIRSLISARISVPSLIRQEHSQCPSEKLESSTVSAPWIWRTDLAATQPFWDEWFQGLSQRFLQANGGKLLLLAGTDRLDKDLMIGQMQGKYQLVVFPEAGHFIHEDQAAKTAGIVADFCRRNDRSTLVLPPKVGERVKK